MILEVGEIFFFRMNPQLQSLSQGYKVLGRDLGPKDSHGQGMKWRANNPSSPYSEGNMGPILPEDFFNDQGRQGMANNPQLQSFFEGYKVLGRAPGPWVTQRNDELNAQAVAAVGNDPRFQKFMQNPILSKDSPRTQGVSGPLTEEELDFEAVKAVGNNAQFQKFMQNPILSKDSDRLQGLPDHGPEPKYQEVQYMDPLYGTLAVTGMSALGNWLENRNRWEDKTVNWGDRIGYLGTGNRGDYTWNQGMHRPDQYVVTQFGARPRSTLGMAQLGGSINLASVPGYFNSSVREVSELPVVEGALDVGASLGVSPEDAFFGMTGVGEDFGSKGTSPKSGARISKVEPDLTVDITDSDRAALDFYIDEMKVTPKIAAVIVGNLSVESSRFHPDVISGKQLGDQGTAFGVAQWRHGRQQDFYNWAKKNGLDRYSKKAQLLYVVNEAKQRGNLDVLNPEKSVEDLTIQFGRLYEVPSEKHANWAKRAGIARKLYDEYVARMNRRRSPSEDIDITSVGDREWDWGNDVVLPEQEEGVGVYERGGEYLVTPKQLKFILANGGEVEFL